MTIILNINEKHNPNEISENVVFLQNYISLSFNKPKSELNMKTLVKIIILVLAVSFSIANTSCSKKSHGYSYSSDQKRSASSYNAASRKDQPVRKKYVVSGKRKTILGHEDPHRSN